MIFVLLGVISFLIMYLYDFYTLKNKFILKLMFGITGFGMFIYATIMTLQSKVIYELPIIVRIVSGVAFIVFLMLLIYSLFLELPFVKTYGKCNHKHELVDTGTYALCRHPGVIWFGFMFLFMFLTTGIKILVIAGLVWTICDIIYVFYQEKYIFKKLFPNYTDYIKSTPMLIPNKKSIKKFIMTLMGE